MVPSPNEAAMISCRRVAAAKSLAAVLIVLLAFGVAGAQSLKVLPVSIQMPPGQMASTLTVINAGSTETAIQIRAYAWSQPDGNDQLSTSDEVLASPPLASIAAGATQVIRLILRRAPQGREATYRILLDQIPSAATPGVVQIVLRLSIPIFAQPMTRTAPHVQFHIERDGEQVYLVGINDGLRHEAIRDIVLSTSDGRKLKTESGASPYILAGTTRRWPIATQGTPQPSSEIVRMTAHADAGAIEQQVRIVGAP
jgi:fimbrial chaperone protein